MLQQTTAEGESEVNLDDLAFHQRMFERLIESDMPSSLLALNRAELLKRLREARKTSALAEIHGKTGLLFAK